MATQEGPFRFKGKLGKTVSYDLKGQSVTRGIGEVDLTKMRTSPQYEATRKKQAEFKVATKAGQLFRKGLLHITQGYTDYDYASNVMKLMLRALRSDVSQANDIKQLHIGLKNTAAQEAFTKLHIFSRRPCKQYKNKLMYPTSHPKVWKLDRKVLYGKNVKRDQMEIKIGYLHIDFTTSIAEYEAALSIYCHRHDETAVSEHTFPEPIYTKTGWTFIILQVWRTGSKQEVTGATFISILDVVEHEVMSHEREKND